MAWWLRNLLCALLQGIFRDYILQVFGFIGGLGSAFFPSSAEVGSFVVKIINAIIFIVIALAGWMGCWFPSHSGLLQFRTRMAFLRLENALW